MLASGRLLTDAQLEELGGIADGGGRLVLIASPEINFAALGSTVVVPAMAGFVFDAVVARFQVTDAGGTATGAATIKVGNNGTTDNLIASTATTLTTAVHLAGLNRFASGTTIINYVHLDLSSPMSLEVSTAATGTGDFSYRGVLWLVGYLAPLAS